MDLAREQEDLAREIMDLDRQRQDLDREIMNFDGRFLFSYVIPSKAGTSIYSCFLF